MWRKRNSLVAGGNIWDGKGPGDAWKSRGCSGSRVSALGGAREPGTAQVGDKSSTRPAPGWPLLPPARERGHGRVTPLGLSPVPSSKALVLFPAHTGS